MTIAAGTTAKVPLDTTSFDPGSNISLANSRYVCPVAGYYQVEANVLANTTSGQGYGYLQIYKNGAAVSTDWISQTPTATGGVGTTTADIIQCNAGDYLELWVQAQGQR